MGGRNRVVLAGAIAVVASGILATGASGLDIETAGKGVLSPGQSVVLVYTFKALGGECENDDLGEVVSNGQTTDELSFGRGTIYGGQCLPLELNFTANPQPILRLTSKGKVTSSSIPFSKIGCHYVENKSTGTFSIGSVAAGDVLRGTAKRTKDSEKTCAKKVPAQLTYTLYTGEEAYEELLILG
jgi:hypothetical protein